MLSCEQCKAYKVEGQVECGICGFDPTAPIEPDPEPGPTAAERAEEERKEIQSAANSYTPTGATPFALVGLVAVAVVGFLILSGSNIFGTGSNDDGSTPDALASVTEGTELGSWNNDGDGDVGSGDDELILEMARACRNEGVAVDGATTYRRTRGAHPVTIVDLRFRSQFTGVDNALQRRVIPRQATPLVLRDTEFLLCATDSRELGITQIQCQLSDSSESDVAKVPVDLPGNNTDYRLVVAATGETLWTYSNVFSDDRLDNCNTPAHLVDWSRERIEFPDPLVWTEISKWAIGRGPEPETNGDPEPLSDAVTDAETDAVTGAEN